MHCTAVCLGVASLITSLVCYLTIWNSPSDVTGTGTVDGSTKKDDKGNFWRLVVMSYWYKMNVYLC